MKYKKEIDGLRAIAVLPVILFHAGFTTFKGGFVGVDIFFVISGYLITTIIVDEMDKGSFSLLNFYERRARRILPALFFMMLCTLPFAWAWMAPQDLESFSLSLVAVTLFASNLLFYLTMGYFDTSSEFKPLLHTWSLAVEEQFYVLFPVFLMLAWKLGKKWIISLLIIVAIISVQAAQYGSTNHTNFNFYLLPTRGFEILIGALISLYINHKQNIISFSQSVSQSASLAGMALVLYAIFAFDKNTPTPSLYTLIPTTGAGLILVFANTQTNIVGKLLGSRLAVGIGLISYSAYLWHQPLFAFARLRSISEPSIYILALLAIISVALGYLSWKFIEMPFRNKNSICRKKVFIYGALASIFFIAIGLIGYTKKGFIDRYSDKQKIIIAYEKFDYKDLLKVNTCFIESPDDSYDRFKEECYGNKSGNSFMVWGDSYAATLSNPLREINNDIIQLTTAGCPPFVNMKSHDLRCIEVNNYIKNKILELKPSKVFLEAHWFKHQLSFNIEESLEETINFIKKSSPKTEIYIVGYVPEWTPTLPILLLRKDIELSGELYLQPPNIGGIYRLDKKLKYLSDKNKVIFISLLDILCVENECLAISKYDGQYELTAWDNGHLTKAGGMFLTERLKTLIINF